MLRQRISRRHVLRAAGAGALGSLVGGSSLPSARAQSQTPPRRLLLFYTQQGTLRDRWAPSGGETDFSLGELHAADLQTFRSELLFLQGLDMRSNDVDPTGPANAHYAGTTHALTGIDRKSPTLPSGPSIDQFIAQQINKDRPLTKLPSLELACQDVSFGEWAVSFGNNGAAIPFEVDPGKAYDRVFAGFTAPNPDDSAAKAKAAQDELVLKWAAGEYDAAAKKFAAADRQKLAAHAAMVRDLQARLTVLPKPTQSCSVPGRLTANGYQARFEAHARLAVAALACDLTRVVTIALPELPSEMVGYSSGLQGTLDLHDLVHKTAENGQLRSNAEAVAPIKRYHQAHAKQFAFLLKLMQEIPEGEGKTLLDHSAVLWCGQLGSGSHDLHLLPWILAGKGGGAFRTGRLVRFSRPNDRGPAHNNLFVSLANYMGVNVTSFGNAEVCTGPLSELA